VLYREVSKEAIIAEYADACREKAHFAKAKWGSDAGMINRYRLGVSLIDWSVVRRWLDVGCGTGGFFAEAEQAGHHLGEMVGVDVTPQMLTEARQRKYSSPVSLIEEDLNTLPRRLGTFELVTLVGVLQQCGSRPERALPACAERLKPDGQLFLTTKNLEWQRFQGGELKPEESHSWFTYEELAEVLRSCQIQIVQSGGFLPREGQIVPLEESHTMYVLGTKWA